MFRGLGENSACWQRRRQGNDQLLVLKQVFPKAEGVRHPYETKSKQL